MTWLWIPITLFAAATQTARNAAQRGLIKTAGTLGATLVRFLYGLPFAIAWLAILHYAFPQPDNAPVITTPFVLWITLGAVSQIAATALLLLTMQSRSFAVATAYAKTEVLQIALLAFVLLAERVSAASMVAIVLSVAGVVMLSLTPGTLADDKRGHSPWWAAWCSPAAAYGIAAGGLFGLTAVGYRAAALLHPDWSPFYAGAYNLVWAQSIQTLLLGGWLFARNRQALTSAMREWRLSLSAGALGTAASAGWLTAFAMHSPAEVRALSLVEVLFSYIVSRRLLKEKAEKRELAGMGLLLLGLVVLVMAA